MISIHDLIQQEQTRQDTGFQLIPSENQSSPAVMEAVGSCVANKYAEGYPGRRYYEGNDLVDQIETAAQEFAKSVYKVPHANLQPYSGSPANAAAYMAMAEPGSPILGLKLSSGGHLTHGQPIITFSGRYYRSIQYGLNEHDRIDLEEVRRLAQEHRPAVMVIGTTAYPFHLPYAEFAQIAQEVGAYVLADISHLSGLVAGGALESPVPYADVVMLTTHKTLRGPRGAILMVTDKGLQKDPELASKIDKAVFPGMQGGPHLNAIAGVAIALQEASTPEFQAYATQVLENAKALAAALQKRGIALVGGGTDNHLMIMDFSAFGGGTQMAYAMAQIGLYANKNTIPREPYSAFYPSGVRIGTPWVTTIGMKPVDMEHLASWISQVAEIVQHDVMPQEKSERTRFVKQFKKQIASDPRILKLRQEVAEVRKQFHPRFPSLDTHTKQP